MPSFVFQKMLLKMFLMAFTFTTFTSLQINFSTYASLSKNSKWQLEQTSTLHCSRTYRAFSRDVMSAILRGVNRLTDQRILTVFSPGFRIQSKILTDLRILELQRFAVLIDFWARILDFACDRVQIVDLSDRQKCLVLFVFVCVCVAVVFFFCTDKTHRMSHIGIPGNSNALWPW